MASTVPPSEVARLRAIAFHLNSVPVQRLPETIYKLSPLLASCSSIFSTQPAQGSETATLIHQMRTKTSSLLQDRTVDGRFTAVILVKFLVDLGAWEILHTSASWVVAMIGILNRPSEPVATKQFCIVALTRIFQMTHDYDNLVREITTPNLPGYVKACLAGVLVKKGDGCVTSSGPLLEHVLRSWMNLMPRHPTIFRPFISKIESVVAPIVAVSASTPDILETYSQGVEEAATRVHVLLHGCRTKNSALPDRDLGFQSCLEQAESIAASLFAELFGREDTRVQTFAHRTKAQPLSFKVKDMDPLSRSLRLLQAYIGTPSTQPQKLPTGRLVVLLQHLAAFTDSELPSSSSMNKNQRSVCLAALPSLHLTILQVTGSFLERLSGMALPYAMDLLTMLNDVLLANPIDAAIRAHLYARASTIFPLIGYSFTTKTSRPLQPIINRCCTDLLPRSEEASPTEHSATSGKSAASQINPNAILGTQQKRARTNQLPALRQAASKLLPVIMYHVPADCLPKNLRTRLEQAAIVTMNTDALQLAVLNPAKDRASLLPFAAGLANDTPLMEAILRPRVPPIYASPLKETDTDEDDDQEEDYTAQTKVDEEAKQASWTPFLPKVSKPQESNVDPPVVSPNKHLLPEFETPMSPKRARLDDSGGLTFQPELQSTSTELSKPISTNVSPPVRDADVAMADALENSPVFGAQQAQKMALSKVKQAMEDSDDDDSDGSFEMPPLVLAGAGSDDDE